MGWQLMNNKKTGKIKVKNKIWNKMRKIIRK